MANLWAPTDTAATVLIDIRLPRTLVAALLGANLGVAGLVLQAITRNQLASPAILGINQGAALGMAAGLVFPVLAGVPIDLLALIGALAAGLTTFAIAGGLSAQLDPMRLILGGVAVGAFAYAVVRFTYTLDDDIARSVVRWTVGDVTDVRWPVVTRLLLWSVPGIILAQLLAQRFNLMALGQASAKGLGADPRVTVLLGALVAAALAGVSVTVAGPIAFAGLIVPHLAKFMFGGDHRVLVPMTALLGSAFMLTADGLSKVVTAP
ncbi:MAG: iron chelate uptake ABC transporter family permease subunit, partial [Pseudomonadota bacterium]